MIYFVSGEDIVSSRNKLLELLREKKNVVRLDGKKNTLSDFEEALAANNLFSEAKTVVLENYSKLKTEAKLLELVEKYRDNKNLDIIFWDETDLSKKKYPKDFATYNFSFPNFYYNFLDTFTPNSKDSAMLLQKVLLTLNAEQVLYGLVKRVRQLMLLKAKEEKDSADFKRMQSWQLSKLEKQANSWTQNQLKKIFLNLAELDEKIKTSKLSMNLARHLDILIRSDLN